ncbi:MAG: VOC family protein [Alphaproteobacteria bacterium]|nr:VOC family protein [Alphaproteobacteria bacterium]
MTNGSGTTFDHIGIVVPDLDRAAEDYEALGFTLSSPVSHETADGQSAGSRQCSIMMRDGYIELQEITGPAGSHLLSAAREKHFGLHIIAFGVPDARIAHARLTETQLPLGEVLEWSRRVHRTDGDREARFAFFVADYNPADEALLCWVQHLTPDAIREPRLLDHANGAIGLTRIGLYAEDQARADTITHRLRDAGGDAEGQNLVRFGRVAMSVSLPGESGGIPQAHWPAPAFAADIGLSLSDPSLLAGKARSLGLPVTGSGDRMVVDMMARTNTRLILNQAGTET